MNLRTMAFAALGTIAFGTSAVSFAQTGPGPQGTPPPPPIPAATSSALISTSPQPTAAASAPSAPTLAPTTPTPDPFASPSPTGSPAAGGKRRRRSAGAQPSPEASPSDTPEPPQFSTLDGVWEIALQPLYTGRTSYSHLYVKQDGNTLTGTWLRSGVKTPLPFTGTFDGRLFKLTVTNGATTETLSGYEENYMDMVGLYLNGDAKKTGVPFTAGHRKSARERERDEDNRPQPRSTGKPPGSGP